MILKASKKYRYGLSEFTCEERSIIDCNLMMEAGKERRSAAKPD
jgi:hypothetical protein